MDIAYTALTLAFFALSWVFVGLCARLADTGQGKVPNR